MLQLLIHNYVPHTHTHRHTHTRIRAWVYNSSMHSVHQGGPAHRGRRAHQSPGRLVDEDGLRGVPIAQWTGQGQSGVSFLVLELVRLQERTASPSTARGRLASCPSSPSLVSSSLCFARARADVERRMRAAD